MSSSPTERVLARLQAAAASGDEPWECFGREQWPELFSVLAVAADLPRLATHRALEGLSATLWPRLREVADDLGLLQKMIDEPRVPTGARWADCRNLDELIEAGAELERTHCVTVDFLFDSMQQRRLEDQIGELATTHADSWGQLQREQAPALFQLIDEGLGSDRFAHLTGFELGPDTYTLTLSLQSLSATGIGWHRDLYWPKEWVGQDVFAVLYGLGQDTADKGGAFLYYVPWLNELYGCYRKRHQATVLWNSREPEGRILHAVSGYHTEDTARHLIIVQCLRRAKASD